MEPMKLSRTLVVFLAVALTGAVFAPNKRVITPQDLWAMKRVGSPSLSPDGKTVVFTVQEWSVREEPEHEQSLAG